MTWGNTDRTHALQYLQRKAGAGIDWPQWRQKTAFSRCAVNGDARKRTRARNAGFTRPPLRLPVFLTGRSSFPRSSNEVFYYKTDEPDNQELAGNEGLLHRCGILTFYIRKSVRGKFSGGTRDGQKENVVRKTARRGGASRVEPITEKMSKRWGPGTFVIPAPLEVDAVMKMVPRGRLITITEIREKLAKKHGATIGCPLTTGIFAWVAAHAAEEERREGKEEITPYWRTLKSGGVLNEKYPGGVENLTRLLEAEGHRVIKKGKKTLVEGYERSLWEL